MSSNSVSKPQEKVVYDLCSDSETESQSESDIESNASSELPTSGDDESEYFDPPPTNTNNASNVNKKPKSSRYVTLENDEIHEKFSGKIIKMSMKTIRDLYQSKIDALTAAHHLPNYQRPPLPLTKQKNTNLHRSYARRAGWHQSDGFREMMQNWVDGCNHVATRLKNNRYLCRTSNTIIQPILHRDNLCYYFFLYFNTPHFDILDTSHNELIGSIVLRQRQKQMVLQLSNYGIALDASQLTMGQTTKVNGTSVGKFGEGLKMGACILLYHNHKFSILTNRKNWKFSIKRRTMFVSPHEKEKDSPAQVLVTIANVRTKSVELDAIIHNVKRIHICDNIERKHYFPLYHPPKNQHIRILDEEMGFDGHIMIASDYKDMIYSNGFFVGEYTLSYFGYNVNGTKLPLTRDRCLTQNAVNKLQQIIPEYWAHAIQKDPNNAVRYLQCLDKGKSTREYMEIHPDNYHILANESTATAIFDAFLQNILPNVENDDEEKDVEVDEYFIVRRDIKSKKETKILEQLRKRPYKINVYLYEILKCSPKFDTLDKALHDLYTSLLNAPKAELNEKKTEFIEFFAGRMAQLFHQINDYEIKFKQTDMKIGCKIIEKQIIFNAKLLEVIEEDNYCKETLFSKLSSELGEVLKSNKIIETQEFNQAMFSRQFRLEMKQETEMKQRENDRKLIEKQREEIEELRKKLTTAENVNNDEIIEPNTSAIEHENDEIENVYFDLNDDDDDDENVYFDNGFADDDDVHRDNVINDDDNINNHNANNNNEISAIQDVEQNDNVSPRKRPFAELDESNDCTLAPPPHKKQRNNAVDDDDSAIHDIVQNENGDDNQQKDRTEESVERKKENKEEESVVIIEQLTNRIQELETTIKDNERKIDEQLQEITHLKQRLLLITHISSKE